MAYLKPRKGKKPNKTPAKWWNHLKTRNNDVRGPLSHAFEQVTSAGSFCRRKTWPLWNTASWDEGSVLDHPGPGPAWCPVQAWFSRVSEQETFKKRTSLPKSGLQLSTSCQLLDVSGYLSHSGCLWGVLDSSNLWPPSTRVPPTREVYQSPPHVWRPDRRRVRIQCLRLTQSQPKQQHM